jgi:hypothetical protein
MMKVRCAVCGHVADVQPRTEVTNETGRRTRRCKAPDVWICETHR